MVLSTNTFERNKFVPYSGLKWSGILKGIQKSQNPLQPLFEAFTNSLESIRLRKNKGEEFAASINISLCFNLGIDGNSTELYAIEVTDTGIGLDDINYNRLITFKDDTKGFNNRGSGRIQFVHFFEYAYYTSVYKEGDSLSRRSCVLSCNNIFMRENSLLYLDETQNVINQEIETKLTLETPLSDKDKRYYSALSLEEIKKAIVAKYILSLCSMRNDLPRITLTYVVAGDIVDTDCISEADIPVPTSDEVTFSVPKWTISDDMKRVEVLPQEEVVITMVPFKIASDKLSKTEIKITSKNEISESTKIKVTCLDPDAEIDGYRYLFLLTSNYFDDIDSDERGNISILDKTELKRIAKLTGVVEAQVVINDIQDAANSKATEIFTEIAEKKQEFRDIVEKLKRDYLLSDDALADVSICDNVEEVLRKAYSYDAKVTAQQTAIYEESINRLSSLNPSSTDYISSLNGIVDSLVQSIPMQNRATLSKYVARRNMVINLMDKILNRLTIAQTQSERNEDEKLLHNLIFRQHSENPLDSDLWLINEEYMYFSGVSEIQLSKITIEGKKFFREDFSIEEERYLTSLGENRLKMRCDILLFPSEGKCVIIEFKNPDVNVVDYLNQVSKYAYFIRNFSTSDFEIRSFYGYLIGEHIEDRDVRSADGDFITAPNDEYLFRPRKVIPDDSGSNKDGSLYMEVMRYSSLKRRAEIRNKAFTDRLLQQSNLG